LKDAALIRVDGSKSIGLGHISRCMSLAGCLRKNKIKVVFLTKRYNKKVSSLVADNDYRIVLLEPDLTVEEEISLIKEIIGKEKSRIMILDLDNSKTFPTLDIYHHYLKRLQDLSVYRVAIEGLEDYLYPSDMVIVPYLGAEKLKLQEISGSKYLLGAKYFVFREEFAEEKANVNKEVHNILITMGGGDPLDFTTKAVRALASLDISLHLNIVIGPFTKVSEHKIRRALSGCAVSYEITKNTKNMARLMSKADIAIINSGLTKYETSVLGLPGVVLSNSAEHAEIMREFAAYGSVLHLGEGNKVSTRELAQAILSLMNDYDRRKKMAQAGRALLDTKGVERIVFEILGSFSHNHENQATK